MQASRYKKHIVVETYFTDFLSEMTVPGMLRAAQSAATEHIGNLGFSEEKLLKSHCAFLLSKVAVECYRPMKSGEGLQLITTAHGPEKIFYPRVTEFYGEDGAISARMSARWLLVDTEKNRILRTSDAIAGFPFDLTKVEWDFEIPSGGEEERAGEVYAGYSAIDRNRHVNNATYADFVMDAFSDRLFAGERPKRFLISYNRQAEMGATIELTRQSSKGLVRGFVNDALCFEAAVEFA